MAMWVWCVLFDGPDIIILIDRHHSTYIIQPQDVSPLPKLDWRFRLAPLTRLSCGASLVNAHTFTPPLKNLQCLFPFHSRSLQSILYYLYINCTGSLTGPPRLVTRDWGWIFGWPSGRTTTGSGAGPREAALIQARARIQIQELWLCMQQPSSGRFTSNIPILPN